MDIINWLDSISIYTLISDYGYVAWTIIRDIVAWILSVGSYIIAGYLWYNYIRIRRGIVEDDSITEFGSDSNFYLSELVMGTGFGDDLNTAYTEHKDKSKEQIYARVQWMRLIAIVIRLGIIMVGCGLLGAEWAIIGISLMGFAITRADSDARKFCQAYESHIYVYPDEDEEGPEE